MRRAAKVRQIASWRGMALTMGLGLVFGLTLGANRSAHSQEPERSGCMRGLQDTESALQEICHFSEGLAAFRMNDLWGYMDRDGQVRIAPQFKQALAFSQGLAAVQQSAAARSSSDCGCDADSDESQWGFIDANGQWAIAPRFYNASSFSQGLARVLVPRKTSMDNIYIDRQGQQALEGHFYQAKSFVGSLALVESADYQQSFITRSGKSVALPRPPSHLPANTRVRIVASRAGPERWLAQLETPRQAFSANGRMLPLTHRQRFELSASPTTAVIADFSAQWRKGLMDERGNWLLPPEFFKLDEFENGVGIGAREVSLQPATASKVVEAGEVRPPFAARAAFCGKRSAGIFSDQCSRQTAHTSLCRDST